MAAFQQYQAIRYLRTGRVQIMARVYGEFYHASGVTRELRNMMLRERPNSRRRMAWLYGEQPELPHVDNVPMPEPTRLDFINRQPNISSGRTTPMAKLDDVLEDLVTANRILASEGVVDFRPRHIRRPDKPERYLCRRPRPRAGRARGYHGVHPRRGAGRRQGRQPYAERRIHGCDLRGATGGAGGRPQSQPGRNSVQHHQRTAQAGDAHVCLDGIRMCRSGIRARPSATPTSWSPAWRWARTWHGRLAIDRSPPDARPRLRRRRIVAA